MHYRRSGALAFAALLSFAFGCGDDGGGTGGGGTGGGGTGGGGSNAAVICANYGKTSSDRAAELGCEPIDAAEAAGTCESALSPGSTCTAELEALFVCAAELPSSAFSCDPDDNEAVATGCESEAKAVGLCGS